MKRTENRLVLGKPLKKSHCVWSETVRSRCMYELRPNVGHSVAWLRRPGLILVCDLLLLRFVCVEDGGEAVLPAAEQHLQK